MMKSGKQNKCQRLTLFLVAVNGYPKNQLQESGHVWFAALLRWSRGRERMGQAVGHHTSQGRRRERDGM